jgi:hypothetical protein
MGNDAEKRVNYTMAYLHLLSYLYRTFDIDKAIIHAAISRNVAAILYVMYKNRSCEWYQKIRELDAIIFRAEYFYSFGQRLLRMAIRNKVIYGITRPLFGFLYNRQSR